MSGSLDYRKLSNRILGALVLGLTFGVVLQLTLADYPLVREYLIDGALSIIGEVFIRFLSMLVVPLVFVSLVTGVNALSEPASLGRIGGKALLLYMSTTAVAVALALAAALLVKPGVGARPEGIANFELSSHLNFRETLIAIVPRNPIQALSNGDMLPIIVFAILFGMAAAMSGKPGQRVAAFFSDLNDVIMHLVEFVMRMAPYGVFALIAVLGATTGLGTFVGVLKYVLLVLVVLVIHAVVTYSLVLKLLTGLSARVLFSKIRAVQAFAFSTASSGATIPVTLKTVEEQLGVDKKVAAFTIPLGATINMDGTAIMQGIATVFIAQYFGVDLGAGQLIMIVLMVVMASVGTAGVAGVGLIMLAAVLASVGLPAEGIALILGVDRVLDMVRTAVNVTGDCIVATVVAHTESSLDTQVFLCDGPAQACREAAVVALPDTPEARPTKTG